MRLAVYMDDPEERAALCRQLRHWDAFICASLPLETVSEPTPCASSILFWDLDGALPPPALTPGQDCALFVCSSDPQKAIDSYALHPTGFLRKPVGLEALWRAMFRCAQLWWPSLDRLEVLSGRVRLRVPYYNLIWAEGTRRGCLIHTTGESIATREPLYRLEQRLPEFVFLRCQRSFVVNLCHIRRASGSTIQLRDGTELCLGRGNKAEILSAYRRFLQNPDGGGTA